MSTERQQRSFIDPVVLAQLSALPLLSRKPMLGNVSGRHASPHRGASVEFAEYRKYVPGDDLRRLDWRAYGRSDRFYIKEFEADTNLRLVLVLDTSGSMDFGSVGMSKLEYARAWQLRWAIWRSSRATPSAWPAWRRSIVQHIPSRRSPAHLKTLYDTLELVQPQGETGLVSVLHEMAETVRQRAQVIIFSDLFVEHGPAARLL